ncbi:hypothetical protein ANN_23921 [Periplaneta americana]|uniref:Uncharacterized protein n=1 Tax=Periplaneta americana TaxID=6978 RepID=A0ABQ8S1Y9_PERAM|nr:hypothetical protein ANN_23921 [Periplaneta americana]
MAGLCEGGNEPLGSLRAICNECNKPRRTSVCNAVTEAGKQSLAEQQKRARILSLCIRAKHEFWSLCVFLSLRGNEKSDLAMLLLRIRLKGRLVNNRKISTTKGTQRDLLMCLGPSILLVGMPFLSTVSRFARPGPLLALCDDFLSTKNDAETDQEEDKELGGSLAEKKLPFEGCNGRNGEREKSSGQKKISDDKRY